jgi:hypothetical protein
VIPVRIAIAGMEVSAYGHVVLMECAATVVVVILIVVTIIAVVPERNAATEAVAATRVVMEIAVVQGKTAVEAFVVATNVVQAPVVTRAKHAAAPNVALVIAATTCGVAAASDKVAVTIRTAMTLPRKHAVEMEMAPYVLKIRNVVMVYAVRKAESAARMARVSNHVNFLREAAAPVIRQKILLAEDVISWDLVPNVMILSQRCIQEIIRIIVLSQVVQAIVMMIVYTAIQNINVLMP